MSLPCTVNSAPILDSNDEKYKQELVKQREKAKARL